MRKKRKIIFTSSPMPPALQEIFISKLLRGYWEYVAEETAKKELAAVEEESKPE